MFQITRSVAATHHPDHYEPARNRIPICVCCGVGVDSVALLIEMEKRGIRPDLITFADTGSEKRQTYLFTLLLRQWLRDVDFPELVIVRVTPPIADYNSLYENCLSNETLPSIAFGFRNANATCSLRWKKAPQDAW